MSTETDPGAVPEVVSRIREYIESDKSFDAATLREFADSAIKILGEVGRSGVKLSDPGAAERYIRLCHLAMIEDYRQDMQGGARTLRPELAFPRRGSADT